MAKVTLPISLGFYVSDALPISAQRCVNFQPNIPQGDTVTVDNLFGNPGLNELASVSLLDTGRGLHVMADIPYAVIGNSLFRLNRVIIDSTETFTTTNLGVIEGTDRVFMADNGVQLCIVAVPQSGITVGKSYIFTESPDTLAEITDPDFDGPAASVVYIAGFFSFHKSTGKKFFQSALNDGRGAPLGTAYDPFDFSVAESDPDQIRAQIVYRGLLYIGGSLTFEINRNIGRTPAPFQRLPGGVIDVGISAPHSLKLFAGVFAFVGAGLNESPAIWIINGTSKQKISPIAIDNELSKLTDDQVENLSAWVYGESGAYFYGLTLPDTCFVYDVTNKRWHERQSTKETTLTQYRVSSMVSAYGRIIVTDFQDGRIGELVEDLFLEYGRLIRAFVTSKAFDDQGNIVVLGSIEAVVEGGVGLTEDIIIESGTSASGVPILVTGGFDPKITLSFSDDGGRTFFGSLSRSLGKLGEYKTRPIWRRMGSFPRSRILRFEISAPVKRTLIKVEAEVG